MNLEDRIAQIQATRRAAGLCVSFDRETPELTTAYGRATRTFASEAERDAGLARLTAAGRNPKVEGTQ